MSCKPRPVNEGLFIARNTATPLRIGAIVLAAGSSSRLGEPKQLIEIDGQPLVRRAVYAARNAGAYQIVVVVGAFAESVIAAVGDLTNVAFALNRDWKSGLASSLAVGVAAARRIRLDGVLVTTTDQPLIASASLRELIKEFESGHRIVAAAYNNIVGVPAVFGAEHFDDLMTLEGDEGAGQWLRSRPDEVTTIAIDNASIDIDTPADVARLLSHEPTRN
ncbi:MAG: nucleotidyltransferase family protein [Gemmatimonadaceae bacterium]